MCTWQLCAPELVLGVQLFCMTQDAFLLVHVGQWLGVLGQHEVLLEKLIAMLNVLDGTGIAFSTDSWSMFDSTWALQSVMLDAPPLPFQSGTLPSTMQICQNS